MTDTQYLSEGAITGGNAADRFAGTYNAINEWIVANADERNIAYVAHTGDIIENWINAADTEENAREEFEFASDSLGMLEDDVGQQGRTVVEMLANYQFYEVAGQRRTGHFRLLQFDIERSEVSVNTYSPFLGDHNANEFDARYSRSYSRAAGEFTAPIDLATRSTQFGTDNVYLAARSQQEIGSAPVQDGEAAVRWGDVSPGGRYGWYAHATDGLGGEAQSRTVTFSTVGGGGSQQPSPGRPGRR